MLASRACLSVIAVCSAAAAAPDPDQFNAGLQNRSGLAFSPDGRTAWWAEWDGKWGSSDRSPSTIYQSTYDGDTWSKPAKAPFSADFSDDDPFVSPDGEWLYFVSDRPVDDSDEDQDANIWRFSLKGDGQLEHLSVNSPDTEYTPVVTFAGRLYFASDRDGGFGRGDVYMAEPTDDGFLAPVPLGSSVNSRFGEWNVWISPGERVLIFESSSRPGNRSKSGDLYFSRHAPEGWAPAIPLESLNSTDSDLLPRMHPDGETLYYTTAPIGGHARIVSVKWVNPIGAEKHLKSITE